MEVPTEIVSAVVIASGVTLAHNTWKLRGIAAGLRAHIKDEAARDEHTLTQLKDIKKKLPNGEVEKTFNMVRRLFSYYEAEIAEWEQTREEVEAAIREKEEHGI
jgi:hypothetical protein